MSTSRRAPVSSFQKFGNKMMELFHSIGLPVGPMYLLKVKGRRSGRVFTNPVAPVKVDGKLYILQAFPGSDWVKNVRVAGQAIMVRGRTARHVRLIEVPPEERAEIAREFPKQVPMGVGIFVKNGVVADKSPASFAKAGPGIPIFRIVSL